MYNDLLKDNIFVQITILEMHVQIYQYVYAFNFTHTFVNKRIPKHYDKTLNQIHISVNIVFSDHNTNALLEIG